MTASPRPELAPPLDPAFVPAILWNRAFRRRADRDPGRIDLQIAVLRPDGTAYRHATRILSDRDEHLTANLRHVERLVKFLLWAKGGHHVLVAGCDRLAAELGATYGPGGARAFDHENLGKKMFLAPLSIEPCPAEDLPEARDRAIALGRHLEGCRIGFDLGGSDRKCAALIDGEVVHSEEVAWSPYFESDPRYHFDGIMDSIRRAAEHLPRVDAIGGSAAGVYVDNEPRLASLFRGVSDADFRDHIRPIFHRVRKEWGDVPLAVANDGEVTALAASMTLNDNSVLGLSMGTSLAAGYCDPEGRITSWLNELAFVPVDYADDAPADEWSGDLGCGVQYFSQQAVARLAPRAGLDFADDTPFPERLSAVQEALARGDEGARRVFESIGACFGYSVAWFAEFYAIRHLLVLGRVTSGDGGEILLEQARAVLAREFPELAERIHLVTPDETFKRHGQAIAAASLPPSAQRSPY